MRLVWLEAAPEEEQIYLRAGFIVAGQKLWISLRYPWCLPADPAGRHRIRCWHDRCHDVGIPALSVPIDRPADEVYGYGSDPTNWPAWAPGLCTSIEHVDGQWVAESAWAGS